MDIRWITNHQNSCLYAAKQLATHGTLSDPKLRDQLAEPVETLQQVIAAAGMTEPSFWSYALPLSPAYADTRKLARMILYRCLDAEASRSESVAQLQQVFDQLQAAYEAHYPNLAEDFALRSGPLREAWEARGPGLLSAIANETDPRLIALRGDCLLVLPVVGGGGDSHLLYNSVQFEAVLANPHNELPEVVRLAWLLGQLNCDLPMFAEKLAPEHVPTLAATSMLIPTLAAASHVDLVHFGDDLLATAIDRWEVASPVPDLAGTLTKWWNAFVQSRPPWDVAVLELETMLFGPGEE